MKRVEVEVRNPSGIHARPGARFVRAASKYRSTIEIRDVTAGKPAVDAKRVINVLRSGILKGHVVELTADGVDEEQAIEGLRAEIESGLGEDLAAPAAPPGAASAPVSPVSGVSAPARPAPAATGSVAVSPAATPVTAGELVGTPAAPGIAIAPPWLYAPAANEARGAQPVRTADAVRDAADEASRQLDGLADRVRALGRDEDAAIFSAQAVMATDPTILEPAIERVEAGEPADAAVAAAADEAAAALAALPDELLAARAADVRDVGARIVRILRGETLELPARPSIAVAEDLPPSVTAEIPPGLLVGIALEGGSPTAHAAILARGLGIPAVVGVSGLLAAAAAGTDCDLGIDGERGTVVVDPDAAQRSRLQERAANLEASKRMATAARGARIVAGGRTIRFVANIGSPADVPRALEAGAEGVGLFRTEFLFMRRQTAPTEAEQAAAYRQVLEAFGPERPVVIRLADIGGDKAIPYLHLPPEANPFLGVRAIRLAYADRGLLRTQLRAILRAGAEAGVTPHVMAPMVATIDDVRLYGELCDEAREGLRADGLPAAERLQRGIMIEIPAAALMAAELAREVDFFSIGTNDLTQYAMAADRGNASLARLHDALHPAVLRLVQSTVAGAHDAGIHVAVCGELAGDAAGALVLVGLGVDELSADAGSLDSVRLALSGVSSEELRDLAVRAQAMTSAAEVRAAAVPLIERTRPR